MSTEAALLKAILANPDDDSPRLVYADWCDENGQEERAEFIRIQCRISRLCEWHRQGHARHPEFDGLLNRELDLHHINQPLRDWLHSLGIYYSHCVFNRGFLFAITCTAEDWIAHADAIRAAQPVREVTLTTMPVIGRDFEDGDTFIVESLAIHQLARLPATTAERIRAEARMAMARRYRGIDFTMPKLVVDHEAGLSIPLGNVQWTEAGRRFVREILGLPEPSDANAL